jgi:hypothetical protein
MLTEERTKATHSIHLSEKPSCRSKDSRNSQLTLTNALAMSTLRRTQGVLRTCNSLAEDCTAPKLS